MKSVAGLIARRLLQLPLILLVIYTVTFVLAWAIPGNPVSRNDGRRPPEEVVQAMLAQYHLDNPFAFYIDYLGKASGISYAVGAHDRPFDLGPSLTHQNWTVNEILAGGLPVSITIGTLALLIAVVIGVTVGAFAAMRPGSWIDRIGLSFALIGISLPTFVIGAVLLMFGAVAFGFFPVGGWGGIRHMVLPAITLSLPFTAYITRLVRTGMIEAMQEPYVDAARARGLSEREIIFGHALRNAILPVISYLGPAAAIALTGSFVVERVFALPGIGTHFVDAVLAKDLTLIMGVVLTFATMLVIFNLVVDVLYRWVDPRIA